MQVRSAANPVEEAPRVRSVVEVVPTTDEPPVVDHDRSARTGSRSAVASRRAGRTRTRGATRPVALTRSQEYRFIRSDLNRLLITASLLGVVMIALLFLLEG